MKRRDVRRAPPKPKGFRVKELIEMRVRPVEVPLRAASAGGGRFETKDITEYKVRWAGSKNNVNYEDEKFDTWVKKSALNPACLAQFHGEGAAAGPAVMLANMPVGDHPSSPGYQGALYLQAWTKQVTASHDGKPTPAKRSRPGKSKLASIKEKGGQDSGDAEAAIDDATTSKRTQCFSSSSSSSSSSSLRGKGGRDGAGGEEARAAAAAAAAATGVKRARFSSSSSSS